MSAGSPPFRTPLDGTGHDDAPDALFPKGAHQRRGVADADADVIETTPVLIGFVLQCDDERFFAGAPRRKGDVMRQAALARDDGEPARTGPP